MDKIDLNLDSTHHVSIAREARDAMKRIRRIGKTLEDEDGREMIRLKAAKAGKYYFHLRGIAKILDDPRGWLDPAKRKEDPCFAGFSQEQVVAVSHWAETAWDEPHRKEMAAGCREWARKCGEASRMLYDRLDAMAQLDGGRPRPLAHLLARPFLPEHYRIVGLNPDGTTRLVRERDASRSGFFLLRNYLRAGRYDTIHPHVRAALWVVHSVEDFLLGLAGRTEAVLSGKAIAAHHARLLHLDRQMRKAGIPENLQAEAERIGRMLRQANLSNHFVRIRRNDLGLPSADSRRRDRTLPPASVLAAGTTRVQGPRRLPEATTIDIRPEI